MPAPIVTALPQAPARLSRPTNFVTESTLFLDNLPNFRAEVNTLSSYINSNFANKYNFGKVNGVRTFPTIFQTLLTPPDTTQDSIALTSSIDTLYVLVNQYSKTVNIGSSWFDKVINEHGTVPYDLEKPLIRGITKSMTRDQPRADFNTTADMFSITTLDNVNDMYQSAYHTYQLCCSNEDNGRVTDAQIIKITDCGRVTDTKLNYT